MMTAPRTPVKGELRHDEPMSRHTSLRVGGPADQFYKPADVADLARFLGTLDASMPIFWFGLGSNLLVRDGGLPGVVIATSGIFTVLEKAGDHRVQAGASVACTQLARQCIRWGYGPSEFFAGIPGTVGGALSMNAGAHGGETWDRVRAVQTIDRHGEQRERYPSEYTIGYRSVTGPAEEWFIGATFEFDPGADPSMETLKALQVRRRDTQPLGLPSCGSVFRNPPGDHAARLIEAAGLKGHRVGGAIVSEKHANFIINTGDATAADIETLIRHIQDTVKAEHGVELVHEVRIVGREAA